MKVRLYVTRADDDMRYFIGTVEVYAPELPAMLVDHDLSKPDHVRVFVSQGLDYDSVPCYLLTDWIGIDAPLQHDCPRCGRPEPDPTAPFGQRCIYCCGSPGCETCT